MKKDVVPEPEAPSNVDALDSRHITHMHVRIDPSHMRIGNQRAGSDAQHHASPPQVIEEHHPGLARGFASCVAPWCLMLGKIVLGPTLSSAVALRLR